MFRKIEKLEVKIFLKGSHIKVNNIISYFWTYENWRNH